MEHNYRARGQGGPPHGTSHPTPTPPHGPNPLGHALRDASVQGIYIGDELLGLGVLVKDLTAILELCKEVWPEGITCESSDLLVPTARRVWH